MVFEENDREGETLLSTPHSSSTPSGSALQRTQCMAGIGVIVIVAIVLGTICSELVQKPHDQPVSGRLIHDTSTPDEIQAAAAARLGNKFVGGDAKVSEGGKRVIPDENSSREAIIDRIQKKIEAENEAAEDEVKRLHPEESDIVEGKSINPRFLPPGSPDEFEGMPQEHGFVWRDVLGVVGALAIFGAFLPQMAHLLRTRFGF